MGTTYVEAVYGASGNYGGSTSNVVTQVVNALSTTSVLTSSPNPSSYGSSVTFTDTVSASSGTPSGTVTFYSCTTSACSTKTSLGTETLGSGKATYSTSSLPGGHHLRRSGLRRLGQLRRLDVQRGDPGGQRALDHLGPHPLAQPVELRDLGHLHRHRLGLFGHAERHGDLLQLHHLGLLAPRPRSGPGPSARARPPTPPRASRWAPPTSKPSTAPRATTAARRQVVSQVVNALSTTSVLTCSPNPSSYGPRSPSPTPSRPPRARPSGTVTFYSCTTSACSHEDLARDRDPRLGQGHLLDVEPAGGHHLRRSGLLGLGQLRRLDVECGDPGVLNVPSVCAAGGYSDVITATRPTPSSTAPTATTSSMPSGPATGSTATPGTTASTPETATTSSSTATATTGWPPGTALTR